ncbi:hypothetical protein FO519_008246 [Halicephalobus sp. NKZ332]|nr:hypothetical protein FO519_008246 [Halicephalobus sp. NKZ332]
MDSNNFYDPVIADIFLIYSSIIGIVTVAIAPVHFYIVLTRSKTLGRFKWFILNHSFWCLLFTLSVVIIKPVILLDAASGFLGGIFRNTSKQTTIVALFVILSLAIMSVGGICMTLAYRYFGLFPGKIRETCQSLPMICFLGALHLIFIFLLGFFGGKVVNIPQEVMVEQALNYSIYLEPFVHEKTFVFISEEIHMISIIAQALVTLVFELLPFTFLFACIKFKIPNSGPTTEVLEIFAVTHTIVEYCITLYFVLPYRRFVKRKIRHLKKMLMKLPPGKIVTIMPQNGKTLDVCRDNQITIATENALRSSYDTQN